jgi:hypothetical protein
MKRTLLAVGVLAFIILAVSMAYLASPTRQPMPVNALKIIAATKTYANRMKAQGMPTPTGVSLKELITRGLLTEGDVRDFSGMEVIVSLSVDETRPQDVLMRARLADGSELKALVDGSVQQKTR